MLCSLTRGLVLRTAQSAQLSARQLRAKQSYNRASCRSSLHHDPALSKIRRAERAPTKNVGEASLARNDLREDLMNPQYYCLPNCTNSTHAYAYFIHLIVGLDRNSDGFLDAVAYPSRCSDWIVFSAAAPPKLPGARHQAKFPCWFQPINVPKLNLEKVELFRASRLKRMCQELVQ